MKILIVSAVAVALLPAQTWQSEIEAGKNAFRERNVAEARTRFDSAASLATTAGDDAGLLAATRMRVAVARSVGEFAEARDLLLSAAQLAVKIHGEVSLEHAAIRSETGAVRRKLGETQEAVANLSDAVSYRARLSQAQDPVAQARDLTALGQMYFASSNVASGKVALEQALVEWAKAMRDDAEVLTALESLATVHRDDAEYEKAAALFDRALRIREIAYGPESSELIAAVDSLAYVYFGMKKYAEAEPLYQRLLRLWETSAGPEHPMVALTLDKMAEFFSVQQRYADAEPLVDRAVRIRGVAHLNSMNYRARLSLMQAKLDDASLLLKRTLATGESLGFSDAMLFETMRMYAALLREDKRVSEADLLDKRMKAVIMQGEARPPPPKGGRAKAAPRQ